MENKKAEDNWVDRVGFSVVGSAAALILGGFLLVTVIVGIPILSWGL